MERMVEFRRRRQRREAGLLTLFTAAASTTFLLGNAEAALVERCEPCHGGGILKEDQAGETLCRDLGAAAFSLSMTSDFCPSQQLQNFQSFCCDEAPKEYCSLCDDSFNPSISVPSFDPEDDSITQCSDIAQDNTYLDFIFEAGDCTDTLRHRAAAWCRCPGVERECFLCPDGSPPPLRERVDKVFYNWKCSSFDFASSLFSAEECTSLVNDILDFDAPSFCGCPDSKKPEVCSLCPEGSALDNPDFVLGEWGYTCAELAHSIEYIPTEESCNNILSSYEEQGVINHCCSGDGDIGNVMYSSFSVGLTVVGLSLLQILL